MLSDFAEIQYKCTGLYSNKAESGILWNDPAIGIKWPLNEAWKSSFPKRTRRRRRWRSGWHRRTQTNFKY